MQHPTDSSCIFCKIIKGDIPCHKVFEGEHVLAFLDVGPLSPGHTLVIPKGHYKTVDQMPDDIAAAIGRCLPRLSKAILEATGSNDWNLLQNNGEPAGQEVLHAHFHLIPRKAASDRRQANEGDGLAATPWLATQIDHTQAEAMAKVIQKVMMS